MNIGDNVFIVTVGQYYNRTIKGSAKIYPAKIEGINNNEVTVSMLDTTNATIIIPEAREYIYPNLSKALESLQTILLATTKVTLEFDRLDAESKVNNAKFKENEENEEN